jgi:hypothetical protein
LTFTPFRNATQNYSDRGTTNWQTIIATGVAASFAAAANSFGEADLIGRVVPGSLGQR